MYYKIINGIRWYYRLKNKKENNRISKGLFSDYPRHTLTKSLIVRLEYYDHKSNKKVLLYTHFKSYLEYGIYSLKLSEHERCFYEIILGENAQKPHFDIDIDRLDIDGEAVKDDLIRSIVQLLSEHSIHLDLEKDVLIYTSHGKKKDDTKQSYHVMINNYCHGNNIEARAFYEKVKSKMNPDFLKWIDNAVYSPTQQFRIVGCHKLNSVRVKRFQSMFTYNGKEIHHIYPETPDDKNHQFVMELEESIIGYTGNCRYLPPFEPIIDSIKYYEETDDVSRADAKQAIQLVAIAGNTQVTNPGFPYKFMGINGPIVMLKRTKPSRCKICKRIHEHENPYLLIVGEEKSVYFHCRRSSQDKKLFLGKLEPKEIINEDENKKEEKNANETDKTCMKWSKNVIEKLKQTAKSSTSNKKYINVNKEVPPEHSKIWLQHYINN